jgi:hypothetical protein
MLTLFMSFRAPGVPYVDIFRDHADPQQFYLLPDRPRIAVDAKTGTPLFDFTLFSRNVEIAYASVPEGQPVESQLGALNLTVDLSVPEADMALVRQHLTDLLAAERAVPSAYNALFRTATTGVEPKVGYVDTWRQGSVRLDMLEGLGATFKRSASQETHPTLHGANTAALWATFGSEGAQLLWGMLHPEPRAGGGAPAAAGGDLPLQANIVYDLDGFARVPALRVSVHADGSTVYKELRKRTTVFEQVGNSRWTYPQVSSLTKELVDSRAIDVQWDDWGIPGSDPKADEVKAQLQQTVMGVITNQITTLFFKQFEMQGLKDEDLGTTFTHTLGGKPGSRLWLNDFTESSVSSIDFTLEQTQNVAFKAYPQTSLLANLSPDQVKNQVRVVDVGSPEIRVLAVHLYTNADFQGDRIANITVSLSYKQLDSTVNAMVETAESYVFRTGQEVFTFRTRLARDSQGRLIDVYDARAQINYIGTSQSPPAIELRDISERALTFSYDRLGYVKVDVQAGDVDWQQIKEVYVDLLYDSAAGEPDAKGTVKLSEQSLLGHWTTSKHGRASNRYSYTVRYVMKDGGEIRSEAKNDDRSTLVVHDTLVGRLRRTFDVVLDGPTVDNLELKVRYEDPPADPEEVRHPFTATGSWEYVRPLREKGPQTLRYAYDVQYKDGEAESFGWRDLAAGDELPTIKARRFRFSILVDGEGLDWTRFRVALVEITYRDEAHGYEKIQELRVTKDQAFQTLEVLGFKPDARAYSYRATLVPRDGGDPIEVPPAGGAAPTRTGALLLETLV